MNKLTSRIVAAAFMVASIGGLSAVHAQSGADASPAAVKAGNYAVESSHARVQFSVSHMGFSDWYGDLTGVTGTLTLDPAKLASSRVDVSIPVASVSTTNAKLDGELKSADWFDAAKYPTMKFVSTKVTKTGDRTATIAGNLTFHGITKPVTLKASFIGAGDNPMSKAYTVGFRAVTTIKRSDFGVKTYLPMIGDDVEIRISAPFERKS